MTFSTLDKKITCLVQIGKIFKSICNESDWPGYSMGINELEYNKFRSLLHSVKSHNGWFTQEMILFCFEGWGDLLIEPKILKWIRKYFLEPKLVTPKTVAIICAGNVPMVGFHDIISGYLSGHKLLVKLSTDDNVLIPAVVDLMKKFDENLATQIIFENNKLSKFDAVIATGSNNTSRYFQDYFGKYPNIIRKSRTSIAVLDGSESEDDLENLSKDVFTYFGLGCRNVTKLFLPQNFNLDQLFKGFYQSKDVINNNKYANNYDYHKAIFLLENFKILENGFILLKEDEALFSPIGTLYYEFYDNLDNLEKLIDNQINSIQCRVGVNGIPFGKAQKPELWDYADNVDTINFFKLI